MLVKISSLEQAKNLGITGGTFQTCKAALQQGRPVYVTIPEEGTPKNDVEELLKQITEG